MNTSNAHLATLSFFLSFSEQADDSQKRVGKPSVACFSEDGQEHPLKYVAIVDRNRYDVIH